MIYKENIAASVTATAQKVLMPIIRQVYPTLNAQQILGVQPMSGPIGSIFTMNIEYIDPNIAKFHKKYKFSRAKWYYCKYKYQDYLDCCNWCEEHFGPLSKGGDAWMRWKYDALKFRFMNEDDAIMFSLRWLA